MNKKILTKKFEITGIRKTLALVDIKAKIVVLYFYPKDDTPGCTVEGKDFSKLYKNFQKIGAEVLGVSRDSLASHEKFKKKYKYTVDLLSDPEAQLCQAFGVLKEKLMFGKKVFGLERSTFVLSPDGEVIKEWRKVKVPGHAKEVLKFISSSV